MSSEAAADLVSQARHSSVVVIGAGMAGLVAALECARVGMPVTLLESSDRAGGLASSTELDGERVDTAADGFRDAPGALSKLLADLGLSERIVPARDADTWVAGAHGVAPLPEASLLGIPANPFDERTRRIIGWSGAWRAYLDRLRPPLTIGTTRSLGELVRARMGEKVADRMVAPLTYGVHGIAPEKVDVDRAVRGLSAALTRTGSLSGAVAQQADAATAARATLDGGMSTLIDALLERLEELDVDVRLNTAATALTATPEGWTVTTTSVTADETDAAEGLDASAVIVATPEAPARALLAPHLPDLFAGTLSPADVDVVTLVLDAPALDAAPRGHAVYAAEGTALSVVHATATWPHDPGTPHIVRVQLPATDRSDETVIAEAGAAATELLGVDLGAPRAAHRRRVPRALPASALSPEREDVRAVCRQESHLGVVGAWVGGNGLTRVVEDASAEAERVRSALLWGSAGEDAPPAG